MAQSILLNKEEVKAEVEHIKKLADDVQRDAEELINVLRRCVSKGIQTEWGVELQSQLEKFTSTQTADAIAEIKQEANKLVEATERYEALSQSN